MNCFKDITIDLVVYQELMTRLSSNEMKILLTMEILGRDKISRKELVDITALHPRTIRYCLKQLCDDGYIEYSVGKFEKQYYSYVTEIID